MILLAYILLGHSEWEGCDIHVFDVMEAEASEADSSQIDELIARGRLPVAAANVQKISPKSGETLTRLVSRVSENADLVMLGLSLGMGRNL
jgi:hypothetical protein